MVNTPAPVKIKKKAAANNASGNRDIREMFVASIIIIIIITLF